MEYLSDQETCGFRRSVISTDLLGCPDLTLIFVVINLLSPSDESVGVDLSFNSIITSLRNQYNGFTNQGPTKAAAVMIYLLMVIS